MKITVRNKIIIKDAPERVINALKNTLTLPNPLYWKLMRMGNVRAIYGVPKDFKYYEICAATTSIGRGNLERLLNYLNTNKIEYDICDETTRGSLSRIFKTKIRLRRYQHGDTDIITSSKNGIIKLGTGYGKTIIAVRLISLYQTPTLIIVPRDHIKKQFEDTIRQTAGISVGRIQGKEKLVKEITIATIQTLVRHPEIALKLQNHFGMVIVDEAHTSITKKRLNVIQLFNPQYLYGMTATPRRTDEQTKALGFTYGPVIIEKDMPKASPTVKLLYCWENIPCGEYADMITEQINNKNRNQLIVNQINEELKEKRKILILTKRIIHYDLIKGLISSKLYKVYSIDAKSSSKERSSLLQNLRETKQPFDCILGTYSMLSTGTDIPSLDTLIFAGDLRSDVLQEQSAGRILRLFGDKKSPKIIDVIDRQNPILFNQAKARIRWYKKQGWLIN